MSFHFIVEILKYLNYNSIDGDIDDRQVWIYQPTVTSRVIFHHLDQLIIIKYWNISLDVTDGWYFRIWHVSMSPYLSPYLNVALVTEYVYWGIGPTQFKDVHIDDRQVLKYQA